MVLQDFRNLKVWEKSHRLTMAIYSITGIFPRQEMYGLTGQLRRAAASVPANIAEGCGRDTNAELARFLQIAMGSASELEYHLLLAHDLSLVNKNDYASINAQVTEVKKMLATLIIRLRTAKSNTQRAHNRPMKANY